MVVMAARGVIDALRAAKGFCSVISGGFGNVTRGVGQNWLRSLAQEGERLSKQWMVRLETMAAEGDV